MTKTKVVILIFLNAMVFALAGYWIYCFKANRQVVDVEPPRLQTIDEIIIGNPKSGQKVLLQKSPKTSKWKAIWEDNSWPANVFAIERFYETIEAYLGQKLPNEIPPEHYYEVAISAKKLSKKIQLRAEDFNSIFSDSNLKTDEKQFSDNTILSKFLDPKIFPHVGKDCKTFKIKSKKWEFTFTKRQGKWFLEHSNLRLEVKNELMSKFFHGIFSLKSKDITFTCDHTPDHTLSILLYGENTNERVSFLNVNEQTCFAENDAVDLFFVIEREQLTEITNTIEDLLKVHIFPIKNCNDISINTPGEYFNFHSSNNQSKWQFTHSKNGELEVKEISQEDMDTLLTIFENTASMVVSSLVLFDDKSFTLTFNEFSDNPQVFSFYRKGDQLFVGTDDQDINFEIASCFEAILFHNIRKHSSGEKDLLW
ncbi:MAG: hypothetical protein LBJ75_00890 [Puniceicoccales bacterium]|jgi:hypothetical protein|nr:hypothetical protein [Puniceicoccales bacterium]